MDDDGDGMRRGREERSANGRKQNGDRGGGGRGGGEERWISSFFSLFSLKEILYKTSLSFSR